MSDASKPSFGPRLIQGPKPKPKKPPRKRAKSLTPKSNKIQFPKFRSGMEMFRFRMRKEQEQEVMDHLVEFLSQYRSTDVGEPKKMPCRGGSLTVHVSPEVVGIVQDVLRNMRDDVGKYLREFDKFVGSKFGGKTE